uniref:Uncharacterized protein n=1 Tax=Caenorhabditis japonica TaxID=281687 RepID=A0A8R1EMB9_CAEJA
MMTSSKWNIMWLKLRRASFQVLSPLDFIPSSHNSQDNAKCVRKSVSFSVNGTGKRGGLAWIGLLTVIVHTSLAAVPKSRPRQLSRNI